MLRSALWKTNEWGWAYRDQELTIARFVYLVSKVVKKEDGFVCLGGGAEGANLCLFVDFPCF